MRHREPYVARVALLRRASGRWGGVTTTTSVDLEIHLYHRDRDRRLAHSALNDSEREAESRWMLTQDGSSWSPRLPPRFGIRAFCGRRTSEFLMGGQHDLVEVDHLEQSLHYWWPKRDYFGEPARVALPADTRWSRFAAWCNACRRAAGLDSVKGRRTEWLPACERVEREVAARWPSKETDLAPR